MTLRGGIDLGGTKIQAVVLNGRDRVVGQARRPTPTAGGPAAVLSEMAGAMEDALADAGAARSELVGAGVGSPGEVDADAGTVSQAKNLPDWAGTVPMGAELGKALSARVAVGNDVQVATEAEFKLGAGKPYRSLLGVFWGTGVGGGLILDGNPWVGRGAGGEIGHTVVVQDGARCPCGRRGCLEAYAGRAAMEAEARRRMKAGKKTKLFEIMKQRGRDRLTAGIWYRALNANDKVAHKLIDRAVVALGTGIASAVNLLDIEAVVIGGGLGVKLGPLYLDRIKAEMEPHLFVNERPPATMVAELGDLGGAIGAALLAPTGRVRPAPPRRRPRRAATGPRKRPSARTRPSARS
jgi:glucokinase